MTPGQAIKKAEEKLDDLDATVGNFETHLPNTPVDQAQRDLAELRAAVDILVRWVKMS